MGVIILVYVTLFLAVAILIVWMHIIHKLFIQTDFLGRNCIAGANQQLLDQVLPHIKTWEVIYYSLLPKESFLPRNCLASNSSWTQDLGGINALIINSLVRLTYEWSFKTLILFLEVNELKEKTEILDLDNFNVIKP